MNVYVKKLCVLKQISSGFAADGKRVSALALCETYAGKLTASLSLLNFAPLAEGRYRAALVDAHGTAELFDLRGQSGALKKPSALDLSDGFSCTVAFVSGKVKPVAFGKCGDNVFDVKKICALFAAEEEPQAEKPAPAEGGRYDDEIVAGENYYDFPDADIGTLSLRKEETDEGNKRAAPQNGDGVEKDADDQSLFRFSGAESLGEDERACYYEKVKGEISSLLAKYPKEEALCRLLPGSAWVRVDFGKDKYYVVGVIGEGSRPKYICYGVPAEKRGEAPAALKNFCSFLPASVFDIDGRGYWMMYQDAETGKSVKLHDK